MKYLPDNFATRTLERALWGAVGLPCLMFAMTQAVIFLIWAGGFSTHNPSLPLTFWLRYSLLGAILGTLSGLVVEVLILATRLVHSRKPKEIQS
jgi:hypothetical protein